jgi:CheY-like chemotaxis protein/cytochrome c-type biogenesis protein CcmH/NrfG
VEQTARIKNKGDLKILVVDDMISMRRTIRSMLRQLGYVHIIESDDGVSAWNRLSIDRFDVAVVDWNMPNMNGITLLKKTRQDERLSDIPFIMVTAEVAEETIAEAAETDVDAYIIKPFVAKTLEEKIEQVLERKKNPSPLDAHLRRALIFANAGQYNKATSELKTALIMQPNSPRVFTAFGDLYWLRGMLDDAEKAYKKALLIEPKFMKAHDSLAAVLMKKGDEKKIIAALKEAVAVSPKNAARQVMLGEALLENGMTGEARKAFKYAVSAEPQNTTVHMEIGEILLGKDMDQDAVELFSAVSKINPTDVHVYNRLGIAYRKQGKFQEAIVEYKKALEVDSGDEHLYYNLGRAYLESDMIADAKAQFQKALELNSDFPEVLEILREIEGKHADQAGR